MDCKIFLDAYIPKVIYIKYVLQQFLSNVSNNFVHCKYKSKTNIMKTLTFSKNKFESKIITHFEEQGIYDYLEDNKESFKFPFSETIYGNTYNFEVEYSPDYLGVYYPDEVKCTIGKDNVELTIKCDNNNPNKETLYQVLQDMIAKQKLRDKENEYREKQRAKSIEDTNEILNQKNR